ncbi:GL11048 [Drosophila persimilis]|nr:intraflagellar transport protein 20 homolog [Drosophila persimilis]EDW31274.1 GL11048 [Drosophila persimilis]
MEELKKFGLFIDDIYRLRVQDPSIATQKIELRHECLEYSRNLQQFKRLIHDFYKISNTFAKDVEVEKLRAIGTQNQLKSMSQQRQAEQQVCQSKILEQTVKLERLKSEYQYLQRTETEQQEIINNFLLNQ